MPRRLALAPLVSLFGCIVSPSATEDYISIEAIEIFDAEGNGTRSLETELHVYDAGTDALLGCAPLRGVDGPGQRYEPRELVSLVGADREGFMRPLDIADRDVYLWVIDRDSGVSCPEDFDPLYDDIVGRSRPMPGAALGEAFTLSFERVIELTVAPAANRAGPVEPARFDEAEPTDALHITELELSAGLDGFGSLEIEVHLWDADSGDHLGCSGIYFGLEGVTASMVPYIVAAEIVGSSGALLEQADVADRRLLVEVLEDDSGACPLSPAVGDDAVFASDPFDGEQLDGALEISDASNRIVLGTARSRL